MIRISSRNIFTTSGKKNAVPKKSSAVVQFRGQDLLCRIDDNGLKFPSRAQFTEPDEAFTYLF